MTEIILYPTETVYGLGVNALDFEAVQVLAALKGRDAEQAASWLVRDMDDVRKYAEVSETAAKIAAQFLPGPLTLILPAKDTAPDEVLPPDRTIGFRISSDPVTQKVIADFMAQHDAPLTCTSANVHGQPSLSTTREILEQFVSKAEQITQVIDDGVRTGTASTVVRVLSDTIEVLREGVIFEVKIRNSL